MLFLTENQADEGTWSSTYGSATNFPVANVQNPQAYRVWRSTEANALDHLILDLGATTTPNVAWYLVVHAHNLDPSTLVTVEGDSSAGFATPPFADTFSLSTFMPGTFYKLIGAAYAGLRYWRISFGSGAGPAGAPSQVGRVYIGPVLDTGDEGQPNFDGVSRERVDPSPVDYSPGRQRFVERKVQYDDLKLDFAYMPESIQTLVRDLYYSLGTVDPFFVQVSTVSPLNRMYYVAFDGKFPEKVKAWNNAYVWSHALNLEEQL